MFLVDDLAARQYRKHPVRRRGRPRGSRSTNRGGLNRAETNNLNSSQESTEQLESPIVNKIRRGPGRPRLKPNGPSNQGNRVQKTYRKSVTPLVVPLGSSPVQTPTIQSPSMSPERF